MKFEAIIEKFKVDGPELLGRVIWVTTLIANPERGDRFFVTNRHVCVSCSAIIVAVVFIFSDLALSNATLRTNFRAASNFAPAFMTILLASWNIISRCVGRRRGNCGGGGGSRRVRNCRCWFWQRNSEE